jgi:hypothetical protein
MSPHGPGFGAGGIVPSAGRLVNSMGWTSLAMMLRFVRHAGPLLLLLCSTPLAAQRSARRVIDAAAIAAAGWHHLGDIAAALPPGSIASVDGFNYELSGSRQGFSETTGARATWLIRLDGQEVPTRLAGLWILDAIPVAITQLDSVVIVEGARLTDGRTAFLGTIDFFTRRPRRGSSIVGDYQHGDESGDPGPYRYTVRATPNVEKLGPFASGAAAFATDNVAIDIGGRYASLNVTDPRIVARLGSALPAFQSDVNASGGSGVATVDLLGGRQFLVVGRGRFTGLMDLPQTSGVQEGRVITTHLGASGSLHFANRDWRFAAKATQLDLGPIGTQPTPRELQRRISRDAFVETSLSRSMRVGVGATFGSWMNATDTMHRVSPRIWLMREGRSESAELALEHAAGRVRSSGGFRLERRLADSAVLAASY